MRRAWCIAAAWLVACGIDVTGASVAVPADAGPDSPAPIPDAAPDAPSGDDTDASVVGLEDAGARWCATQGVHDFCDDFDVGSFGAGWNQVTESNATHGFSTSAKTPPRAYSVVLPGGGSPAAKLTKTFSKSTTHVVCEVDVFPAVRDTATGSRVDILWITVAPATAAQNNLIAIDVHATTPDTVVENGGSPGFLAHDITKLDAGAWRHLKVDLDLAGSGVKVSVDGVETSAGGLHLPTSATDVAVTLGAPASLSDNGWTFRYDDIVCDLL